jgi:DNA uptake protein ComE-like DNA-binding protein
VGGSIIAALAVWGVVTAASVGQNPTGQDAVKQKAVDAKEDLSEYLPPGDGREETITACTECHNLQRILAVRKSKEGWAEIADKMIKEEEAKLTPETVATVSTYLGQALGPDVPPLVDLNTATRDDLVKVPGVTPELADKLLAHREANGAFASRDDARPVLGLDDASWDKAKAYLWTPKNRARRSGQ